MTPCALCPTTDGVRPVAMVRAMLRRYRWIGGRKLLAGHDEHALCLACLTEAKQRGDVSHHSPVEVL